MRRARAQRSHRIRRIACNPVISGVPTNSVSRSWPARCRWGRSVTDVVGRHVHDRELRLRYVKKQAIITKVVRRSLFSSVIMSQPLANDTHPRQVVGELVVPYCPWAYCQYIPYLPYVVVEQASATDSNPTPFSGCSMRRTCFSPRTSGKYTDIGLKACSSLTMIQLVNQLRVAIENLSGQELRAATNIIHINICNPMYNKAKTDEEPVITTREQNERKKALARVAKEKSKARRKADKGFVDDEEEPYDDAVARMTGKQDDAAASLTGNPDDAPGGETRNPDNALGSEPGKQDNALGCGIRKQDNALAALAGPQDATTSDTAGLAAGGRTLQATIEDEDEEILPDAAPAPTSTSSRK
nr:hypothetical protein CFP56_69110 [Quercus suber]